MAWFGTNWGAPCCEDEHVLTPVGVECLYCKESVELGDRGFVNIIGQVFHLECQVRMIVGSVGHQMKQCYCYGGNEEDPPGLTRRQAAIKAKELFDLNNSRHS